MAAKMLLVLAMAFLLNVAAGVLDEPCKSPSGQVGIGCVRQILQYNGGACLSWTSKTKVDDIVVRVPVCDLTLVKKNCVFEGMSQTYVKGFGADYDYDVIILLLFYPKVRVRCDMDIHFHQLYDVTKMVPTRCDATYINYSTTTLFGFKCGTYVIDIDNRQTYPGMTQYSATFGSPALTSASLTDPRVAAGVKCIKANLKTVMTEIQVQKCKAFATYFIRNRLVEVENENSWEYPI